MSDEKKTDWKKARERRLLTTSASQHETFALCERKWWLSKVRKLPDATTTSQVFGTVVHGVIERFLLADDLGRGPNGESGDDLLYPEGWQIAKGRFGEPSEGRIDPAQEADVKRLITAAVEGGVIERLPGRKVESQFNRQVVKAPCIKCGGTGSYYGSPQGSAVLQLKCEDCNGDGHGDTVMMTGFIDVEFRDEVQDHKTTKSMRYAKSPNKLKDNIQMLIYAWEILQKAKDRGEPLPAQITLRHNQFCAPENKVRKTSVPVTREHVESHWQQIVRNCIKMAEFRQLVEVWHDIPDPRDASNACNAYGGCAFRSICSGQENEEMYEKRIAKHKDMGYSAPVLAPNPIKGTTTVGNFEEKLAMMQQRNRANSTATAAPGAAPALPVDVSTRTVPVVPQAQAPAPAPTVASGNLPPAPAAPVEVPGVGTVKPPPWAVPGCNSCNGIGFSSKGSPCRICDVKSKMQGKPQSADYFVEGLDGGMVMWMNKANESVSGTSWITGHPGAPVVSQAKEAMAPTGPLFTAPSTPAAPTPAIVQHNATPAVPGAHTVETVQAAIAAAPVAKNVEPAGPLPTTLPAGTVALPAEVVAAAAGAPAKTRVRRTKEQIAADNAKLVAAGGTVAAEVAELGLIMVVGCGCLKASKFLNCMTLDEVFAQVSGALAKAQGVGSYFDLDPFKRRDELAKVAGTTADMLGDCGSTFLFCDPVSPDVKAFFEALRLYASTVIVASK